MDQHRGLKNAIALVLAAIITAGGMSMVGSFVLCVGSNGHADLELALGLCCLDTEPPRDDAGGENSASFVDSCGGCSDIGLDASSMTEGRQRLLPPQCIVMEAAGQFSTNAELMLDSGRGAESGPPHLENLRTVVLLT